MKIGYLIQQGVEVRRPPFTGPANHVRHVIQELEKLGHQVQMLVRLEGQIWKSDDLANFAPVVVRRADRGPFRLVERVVRRVQSELRLPYASLFESLRFAMACCQEMEGCDVFYERMSWMSYGGGLAAQRLGVPLVLEDNGDHLADLEAKGIAPGGMQRRLALFLMRRAVERAAHVISSGEGWRAQFIRRWRVPPHRVTAVENGTMLVEILKRGELRSFRENGRADHLLTLVYVGGFYPWHGIPTLLGAFARVIRRGTRARLLLIGAGTGIEAARRQVQELALDDRVTFTGQLPPAEFARHLAEADIGVSPYCNWPEFSGLKLFDYKAAGLATIASGRDGQPTTLRHGETGLIVPPCDEETLAQAIEQLAADPNLRRRMGQAARLEAEQIHGWDHTARQIERVLRQVLAA